MYFVEKVFDELPERHAGEEKREVEKSYLLNNTREKSKCLKREEKMGKILMQESVKPSSSS